MYDQVCLTSMDGYRKLLVCFCLLSTIIKSNAVDTITPGQSIRDGETIVSSGQTYELGFFTPGSSSGRYLGIWFKKISTGTVIWVANRETPILDHSGVLNFTYQGTLLLLNRTNGVIWSSNNTRNARNPIAQLLESGNFVVKEDNDASPDNYLYQSFDYPGDTNLPGMKLGRNFVTSLDWTITSWKSLDDPAKGDYSFGIDPKGYPQLMYKKGDTIKFRAGSWNGIRFTGAPRLRPNPVYRYEFVLNEKEVDYNIYLLNSSVISRLVVNASGVTQRMTWIDQTHSWATYFAVGEDQCDNYNLCGVNAKCNINKSPLCDCLEGFEPRSARDWSFQDWSGGCVRKTALACARGEGFVKHSEMKMPDTSGSWYNRSMNIRECEELCLRNCSCVAYASTNITEGTGCLLWFSDLIDIREFPGAGQDLYVRMAASYLDGIKKKEKSRRQRRVGIIVCTTTLGTGILVLGWIFCMKKRKHKIQDKLRSIKGRDYNSKSRNEDLELPVIDLVTIMKATDNFSSENKLGEGGFGPVYKGILTDGQEIAVKRLSKSSGQGLTEFENEVILISKLQHRNLVKLLGYCIQKDEKMLIYEFMPNKSLDFFVFDEMRCKFLDWDLRIHIIDGIARGLLYLHQDSRLRIIHRDLKASNVLLDKDMNPKISDFGMARIFGGDQTEANTNKVAGTYGYMAPEYAVDGLFSMKSDVFSFGVLVLEIISGKKNRGFFHPDHSHNLLGHAWKLLLEGRSLDLVDKMLDSFAASEVLRCIHVGLLCVQQRPEDRPNMSSVVVMLGSENLLPQPKQPGFFTERNIPEVDSSSSKLESLSINEMSTTVLEAR
ncbi:G-type lectin S-receptor-like serine/threonine-protein kinase At4g27290 isoform X2 [Ricinus communis]|uniref:G-type lectin S-receptor-like serine/threonine-protein kinase At4g27290 isoform X2 n=1 Tax=Ricinus communis TaxID=3988 RepID=UPI00201AFB6E|nr:G-type lectin S-receptor-like serine/threonine-protein kinase At4g27290 isoform X2 [Ricinus communis]